MWVRGDRVEISAQPLADDVADLIVQCLRRPVPVEDHIAAGRAVGEPAKPVAHPFVEGDLFRLDPVEAGRGLGRRPGRIDTRADRTDPFPDPTQADLSGQVEQDREVGDQGLGGPPRQRRDLVRPEPAPGALIGDGRVDEAVADHNRTPGQCRLDDPGDMLGAVRGVEQRLGARVQPYRGVEQQVPQRSADGGPTRFAGDHNFASGRRQP